MDALASFQEAAKAGDYTQVIRLAKEADKLAALSDASGIGLRTLRGMELGKITPSRNQQQKITRAINALT